jgi:hypothetical protein
MSRTKGAKGKHNKEKHVKEKKKRGRPSKQHQKQYQHQTVNVNVNGGGDESSRKSQIPAQIPSYIFDPSLINPHYGINDRQPVNPPTNSNPDMITPLLQAMIANQKQNQQQQIIAQPTQPTQQPTQPIPVKPKPQPIPQPIPIKPKPIKQPENPPIILPPKPEKPAFTHEDVQHLIDEIHKKQKKEIPEPIPQNEPKKPQDTLGLTINDKYDGLKMKNKTMPVSEVVDGTVKGVLGGAAMGLAGASIINNAVSTLGGMAGYYIGGDYGAIVGSIAGAAAADKYQKVYPEQTRVIPPEQTHETSYSQQRVNGGTVVETRNISQREPSYKEPKQKKMLISRLGDAIKDVTPSNRAPPRQKIKESKLLLDLERQQKNTYGTIQPSDVQPQEPLSERLVGGFTANEPKPSTLTQIKEGARDIYRRLSGQKKGKYSRVPTTDEADVDFKSTLERSKKEGQTHGTYAILPQDEPDIDFEKEMEAMTRNARTRRPRDETTNLMDQIVNTPNPQWPAMQQFKAQNEVNIRKSIIRTDQAEREQRIKDGLATPTRPPRTPKQKEAVNNFRQLIQKSSLKKKEKEYNETITEAEPLIKRRILNSELKVVENEINEFLGKEAQLKTRAAKIGPLVKNQSASQIQRAMKSKIARDTVKKRTQAIATIQGAMRNRIARDKTIKHFEDQAARVENMLSATRSNLNEQRPKGLRDAKKALQDRRSELVTRSKNMNREQKKAEFKELNTTIQHYDNVIDKKKPGPKTGRK